MSEPYAARPRNGLTWKQRVALGIEDIEVLPPRVDRDPCVRCGVRGDVGCSHAQVANAYPFTLGGVSAGML